MDNAATASGRCIGAYLGSFGHGILVDGGSVMFDVYSADVEWDAAKVDVLVHQSDSTPLIGMSLIEEFELRIQAVDGGVVTLTRL